VLQRYHIEDNSLETGFIFEMSLYVALLEH